MRNLRLQGAQGKLHEALEAIRMSRLQVEWVGALLAREIAEQDRLSEADLRVRIHHLRRALLFIAEGGIEGPGAKPVGAEVSVAPEESLAFVRQAAESALRRDDTRTRGG